ncbi:MAG: ThuA domain-containing protein [Planctomycetota bacterium]
MLKQKRDCGTIQALFKSSQVARRSPVARRSQVALRVALAVAVVFGAGVVEGQTPLPAAGSPATWRLVLESRVDAGAGIEAGPGGGAWVPQRKSVDWQPQRTAVVVCDVWDYHHSVNAVRRLNEMAPRLNRFVAAARKAGATIIHAPSDCMAAYEQHPARQRAIELAAAVSEAPPPQADDWNHCLPTEKNATYPVDQSDGGEDDDPLEHAAWARQLEALGRNPAAPWLAQSPLVEVDGKADLITDKGGEIWKILRNRGVDQVLLVGVHTNMCVLGRPFGLRQMKAWGKQVALVSDLTDTMYNPARWPFVSHFAGTDLVIEYIQQHVCPTITSDQVLGGSPFRYQGDTRPTLAFLISEDEYETRRTLKEFAEQEKLRNDFRLVWLLGRAEAPRQFVDLSPLRDADLLLVSVRRQPLSKEQLAELQGFVRSGKPVLGIRTASHAFAPRSDLETPPEFVWWPEFDAEAFGGSYSGHFGNELFPTIVPNSARTGDPSPLLAGSDFGNFRSAGSLYRTAPVSAGADVILLGEIAGEASQPAAWSFVRRDAGRSFYTSLGHRSDFEQASFRQLLLNAIRWCGGLKGFQPISKVEQPAAHWSVLKLPAQGELEADGQGTHIWARCTVEFRRGVPASSGELNLGATTAGLTVWVNGEPVSIQDRRGVSFATIPAKHWSKDDANQLVARVPRAAWNAWSRGVPTLAIEGNGWRLEGNWEVRAGGEAEPWTKLPLPPRFGGSANIVFPF